MDVTAKPLSIYIHIPFCVKKCLYCDFLSAEATGAVKADYLRALLAEIEQEAPRYAEFCVETIFIGGGTPSVFSAADIGQILSQLRSSFHFLPSEGESGRVKAGRVAADKTTRDNAIEITMEINPGSVNLKQLSDLRRSGVNRLSIGLQSANDEELRLLGRIHGWDDFVRTYEEARRAGFDNINVDLMAALPTQTMDSYLDTLTRVTNLEPMPEHLSAYSLIIEEGTPFYDLYAEGQAGAARLPDEDSERAMYYQTAEFLQKKGYGRYEISNYAQEGYHCRHNVGCWQRADYVGFGLGAASLFNERRWSNTRDLTTYCNHFLFCDEPDGHINEVKSTNADNHINSLGFINADNLVTVKEEYRSLSVEEQMEEFMFLGMRLTEGVSVARFHEKFGHTIESIYGPVLNELVEKKLIEVGDRIKLTSFGTDISNYVFTHFLLYRIGEEHPIK
ncbi:MAG: radical SAM protein [Lachnospiraceae bacterium]|jgi:oxygen-independent coproporphyrinogen-3 oxidase|nr:radical SAM protein [Lachnospiraceae bacterium]